MYEYMYVGMYVHCIRVSGHTCTLLAYMLLNYNGNIRFL
jgi:hypothetical protein